jgi:hypothetical protein
MPCYIENMQNGTRVFICGDLGRHCTADKCAASSDYLCDYPVGNGKTCDLPLCGSHAYEVAPNIHYCYGHLLLWKEFRESGRMTNELKNVIPFREK